MMFFIMGITDGHKEFNYDSGGMNICKNRGYCQYGSNRGHFLYYIFYVDCAYLSCEFLFTKFTIGVTSSRECG